MVVAGTGSITCEAKYRGLRMTAAEYLQLEEDGHRYELVHGVVCMSPSPTFRHQEIAAETLTQLRAFLHANPVGVAVAEIDVHLPTADVGGEVVYRPDIVFVRNERVPEGADHVAGAPDLIVEIVSHSSRSYDTKTKKDDYERAGVAEYWIIDPELDTMSFYALRDGRFVEVAPGADKFQSVAVAGFSLDLKRLRDSFSR